MPILAWVAAILALVIAFLGYLEQQEVDNQEDNYRMAESSGENIEAYKEKNMSAFILGATGEVGKALLKELVQNPVFSRVVLIGRREVKYEDEKYAAFEQKVIDFDKVEEHADAFTGLDVGFCCLGTTRGKAGAEGFYKVDHDYIMNSAKIAKEGGCKDFHLVSSKGADHKSSLLYTKTKGQVEEEMKELGFERLSIYRPGILMCDREESRKGEAVARFLLKPVAACFPTAISVPTNTVAKAMVNAAVAPRGDKPWTLYENKAIHQIGGSIKKK